MTVLDSPVPRFHLAIPVDDLAAARRFYGEVLGLTQGRSAEKWVDWNLQGHQVVTHLAPPAGKREIRNPVDGHEVPVPHFGLILSVPAFRELARRLRDAGVTFEIEPYVRFEGETGEQWTMFCYDPAGNALEFKAFADDGQVFAVLPAPRFQVRGPGTPRYDHTVPPNAVFPAPVNLVQSLAGSAGPDGDLLGSREDAVGWLRQNGLLSGESEITNSEHGALLRLRDALRDVRAARVAGREDSDAAGRLSRALADGRLVVTVTPAGSARLASSARAPYSGAVAAIAIAVAETGV